MNPSASSFIEWTSKNGRNNAIILVYDEDENLAWFEHTVYDSTEQRWKTQKEIESVSEVLAVNYPEDAIDEIEN